MTREQFINKNQEAGREIIILPVLATSETIEKFMGANKNFQKRFLEVKADCKEEFESIREKLSFLYNYKKEMFIGDSEDVINDFFATTEKNVKANLLSSAIMTNLEDGTDVETEMINLCNKDFLVDGYMESFIRFELDLMEVILREKQENESGEQFQVLYFS